MKRVACLLVVLSIFSGSALRDAHASPELRRAAILTTMAEAAVASAALIHEQTAGGEVQVLSWTADYSERNWVFRVRDEQIDFTLTGYLWGEDEESWLITYSGVGRMGEDAIWIHGRADWPYDEEISDYQHIDFRQVMKFGEDSLWGWVLGAETIIGGTIGAGAAVAGSAVATSGVAVGAAPWIASGGALAGSSALIGASAAAKSLLDSNEPVPPPPAPERPAPPEAGKQLLPSKGTMFTALSHDGRIIASGPDGMNLLVGDFKWGDVEGSANGSIAVLDR